MDGSKRRCAAFALVITALCGAAWFGHRASVHPEFGRIYTAEMVEDQAYNWQTGWEKSEAKVRRWLHLPQRKVPPQYGLQIGPALLGWSLGGHIYMTAMEPSARNTPRWEFALSARRRLRDVTREDLQCEFYGVNDPRGTNIFGPRYTGVNTHTAWEGHAIRVPDGQVIMARLITNRSTVYVIQLGRSRGFVSRGASNGRTRVRYVRVESPNAARHATPPPQ
jgi:hypothetical protein